MEEFKIEGSALRREARSSAFLWGSVFLLMVVAVLFVVLGEHKSSDADMFAITVLGVGVAASIILVCREALHYAFRQMVFVLTGKEIIRRRKGYSEVRIAFSEIENLSEELGYLIVESDEPRKKIAIPHSVSGYEAIRTELSKYCQLSARVGLSLKGAALLAASLASWTAFLRSTDARVVIAAGGIALITLAFGSRHLWKLLRSDSNRSLFWVPLAFAWLIAFLLMFLRITGF